MSNKTIKVGIIGCGAIARLRHAPEYYNNSNSRITAFYDFVTPRAQELSEKYNAIWYEDYNVLLNDPEIDAVSICTPNDTHAEITIAALKAGKHVLCEKPMATRLEDAIQMNKCAKEYGKNLMIGYNQRFIPAHIKAKQIISSGILGKVISFRTTFKHSGPENWSVDKGSNIWFFDKKLSCFGVMGDLGVHKIDLIQYLINENITQVYANNTTLDKRNSSNELISVEDNSHCTFITENGSVGTLEVSWTNYGFEDNSTILYCQNGAMRLCNDDTYDVILEMKDKTQALIKVGNVSTNDKQLKSGVIDEFVTSIIENRKPAISGLEGIKSLAVVKACFESSENGGIKTNVKL